VLALYAQRILDNIREKRKRKLALFQTLLTSRATPKRDAYYPSGLIDMENEGSLLRKAAIKIFEGNAPLKIHIDNPNP
jgi:hypothetical protein